MCAAGPLGTLMAKGTSRTSFATFSVANYAVTAMRTPLSASDGLRSPSREWNSVEGLRRVYGPLSVDGVPRSPPRGPDACGGSTGGA